MTIDLRAMLDNGFIDRPGVICAALMAQGWNRPEAETLLEECVAERLAEWVAEQRPRAPYRGWNPTEIEALRVALAAAGWKLPNVHTTRRLAERLGRTFKSTQSRMERLLAEREGQLP